MPQKGFTLIELLVVIAIIEILAGIVGGHMGIERYDYDSDGEVIVYQPDHQTVVAPRA